MFIESHCTRIELKLGTNRIVWLKTVCIKKFIFQDFASLSKNIGELSKLDRRRLLEELSADISTETSMPDIPDIIVSPDEVEDWGEDISETFLR